MNGVVLLGVMEVDEDEDDVDFFDVFMVDFKELLGL